MLSSALTPVPAAGTPYFLRSELADALSLLTADTPDTLQELVRRLDERLGADSPVRFRTVPVGGAPALVVDVDWQRTYATSSPVKLDLVPGRKLAGAGAEGLASIAVGAKVDVGLVVPLGGTVLPTSLQVLDTSQVSIDARASVEGSVSASIGPLSVSLGKPSTAVPAPTSLETAVAKAHYSLGLGLGGVGSPVSLSSVLADTAPVVNGYDDAEAVDCQESPAPASPSPLALCARLPLYVGSGTSFSSPTGVPDIALRLPKNAAVTDLFTYSTTQPVSATDPRRRLQAPTADDLSAAFATLLLDFGTIGDGLDAFLVLIEDGLNAASLEGKLPLVGGDLQAGSDFVGDLRVKLDALFATVEGVNGGKLPSIAQVQALLGTQFEQALTDAGANPEDFSLDLTCKLPPTNLTAATPNGAAPDPTTLRYGVLTQGETGGGATVETVLGTTMDVTAAATATVQLEWTGVAAATGYLVVRSADGGATYDRVAKVEAGTTTHADVVATPGELQAIPTEPAIVATCTGVTMVDLQGVQIRADIGTGDPNAMDGTKILGCTTLVVPDPKPDKECLTGTLPLDIGIPGLSLRASRGADGAPGGLTGKLGYRIHLALELDRTNGFSILTEDPESGGAATPEIAIGASVDLSSPGEKPTPSTPGTPGTPGTPAIAAELAFLDINVYKDDPTAGPGFAARFAIDLTAPGDRACFVGCDLADPGARLGFADLQSASSASDVVRTELRLEAHIAWFLKAEIESALPGVQTVFVLDWATTFDPTGGSAADEAKARGQDLTIAFNEVAISAGGFLSQVLGPIVEQMKSVTGPLQPVIDTLYAPIPVISDLSKLAGGGDVTLITLAKAFSTVAGGPKLEFIDTVAAVITFVNALPTGDAGLVIPIGSFTVVGTAALATPATPDNGGSLIGVPTVTQGDLAGALDGATTNGKKSLKPAAPGQKSVAEKAGFAFPVLENPGSIFTLIMGQDIDLVTFDSGDLTLGFTWRQSFGPVYAPPPVFITLSGSASVTARIYAGFDTYGIRKTFEEDPERSTLQGIAQVLDGLFFFSTDESGAPLPVITLFGEIAAGAAVSAVIITVGIEGGVRLTVAFSWNDPNGDGKFRLFEFGQVALRNPICLFQVSGQLTLFLRVYITIGVSIFSVSFDFTLVEVTLLDFSAKPDCEPPPPLLAGKTGRTLVLFAGKFGGAGPRGDAAWANGGKDDVFKVTALHKYTETVPPTPPVAPVFTGVRVQALGITEDFLDPNLERVVLDGRGYAGKIKATFLSDGQQTGSADKSDMSPNQTGEFKLEVVALGGSNVDTIKAGTGNALIDGGAENDALTTSDTAGRTVRVAGGLGNDGITTSNAAATVSGDSALGGLAANQADLAVTSTRAAVQLSGLVNWVGLTASGEGEGEGVTGGNDRIAVGLGANTVYGGPGDDSVGVAADDPRPPLQPANAALRSAGNTIVLGTGNDSAKGGTGPDTIWTGPKTEAVRATLDGTHGVDEPGATDGGALRNVVDAGSGGDTVFGSTAIDLVTGGSLSSEGDHLRGGGGKDVLLGGLGTDALFGGPGQDWVVAEPASVGDETGTDAFGVIRSYAKTPLVGTPRGKLLVGGDDADRVVGGDGASTLFGDRYETDPCGTPVGTPPSTQPVEPTAGTAGRDLVLGGNGIDKVKAGSQADRVEALGGDDLLCGQAGGDEILAAVGADTVWGGTGDDLAYGDSGSDKVFGNEGNDRLFGGQDTDVLEGNNGADDVFGGTEDDVVVGGTRAAGKTDVGRDELYGDEGKDVLVGDNSTADGSYPVDLADLTAAATGGADFLTGGNDDDKAYGGLAADEVLGDAGLDDLEGNGGADTVRGGAGNDQVVGGSSQLRTALDTGWPDTGDLLFGDAGLDVITGDNAQTLRTGPTPTDVLVGRGLPGQQVTLRDRGFAPSAGTSGADTVRGGSQDDAVFGQSGDDLLFGEDGADLVEGGPDVDRIEGGAAEDDLVGGSSALSAGGVGTQPDAGDVILGQGDQDVITGDNAALVLTGSGAGTVVLQDRGFARGREVRLYDLGHSPSPATSGDDDVQGGDATDAVFGQTGADKLAGQGGADLIEGGPDADRITGGAGEDDLVGGSSVVAAAGPQPDSADDIDGGDAEDVALGDNGALRRVGLKHPLSVGRTGSQRGIDLLDLGDSPDLRNSGGDLIRTGAAMDVVLAQSGDDHVDLGAAADYGEGGPGRDLVQGQDGEDDLVGGSFTQLTAGDAVDPAASASGQPDSADQVRGGADDDVITGDNAVLLRTGVASRVFARLGSTGALTSRRLVLLDRENPGRLAAPATTRFGGDQLAGGSGVDLVYGQDGADLVSGGGGADYLQGNGGADLLRGDSSPEAEARLGVVKPPFFDGTWQAPLATYDDGVGQADGQDDVLGGSDVRGFRDGGDTVEGNGGDDAVLADNGSLVRTVSGVVELTYTARQRPTVERVAESGLLSAGESTRFCVATGGRCEVIGAFGNDTVYGDGGDDGLWAQDGNDTVRGGTGDDDVFGELGDDTLFGESGQDVLLGDRGGVRNRFETGISVTVVQNAPPAESYTAVRNELYDRRVDLQNDTNGQAWVGTGTQSTTPLGGLVAGGRDRIRGGTGADQIHAGFGDDLANGDGGGDELFGDDGSDALWGGKGCELGVADNRCVGADLGQRGRDDTFVDHLMGGRGGATSNSVVGADVHDWAPRGVFAPGGPGATSCVEQPFPVAAGKTGVKDPCDWFRMTDTDDAMASNNQHHQGTDWIYGGWGRDVMQGDLAANGPNPGDRLIDWNGTYNLYNHCNAAYGGFNDVRQHSPNMQTFLQGLAYGMGAGQEAAHASTAGTSAFRELQFAYPGADNGQASGSAYPSTPAHFDDPVACSP